MSSSANRPRRPVAGERARSRSAAPAAKLPPTPGLRAPAPPSPPAARPPAARQPVAAAAASLPESSASQPESSATRRQWAASAAALVASLVVLAVLLGLTWRDPQAQTKADRVAANTARSSIEQMLSYNYKTIDAQAAQIETLLTGPFKAEFTSAMNKDIMPLAVKNQSVVQARVSDVGVMSSTPTTVRVLAFVNQARVEATSTTPTVDQNRVIATMSKVGDRWLISKVEAF